MSSTNGSMRVLFVLTALAAGGAFACGGAGTAPNPPPEEVPPNVTVSEDRIDFGMVDCGGAASVERGVKITNSGGGTVSWTAELEAPGFSIVGATSGTFTGGGVVNVKVRANAFPETAEAGTINRATLIVNIDKTKIFRTPLQATSQGGTIVVTPGSAVFGEIPMNTQAPNLPLEIKNTGNKKVTISFAQPSAVDFGLTYTGTPQEIELAPGASVPGAAGRFRPTRLVQQTTTAPIRVNGAVCGASAKAVTMVGKGTGGVVGISPGELDYGNVNCGGKGNFQVLTLLNSGTAPFSWTADLALGAGSYFDVSPSSGTVLAGSQQSVFVTPKDIPTTSAVTPNLYGDTLTVTTDAANDTPHDVALKMGARGAILAFTAVPAGYGTRNLFSAALNQNVTVTNSGNNPAAITLTKGTTSFTFGTTSTTVAGGGAFTTTVGFSPADFGDVADTLGVTTTSVLCAPLPAGSALTGRGKGVASSVATNGGRIRVSDAEKLESSSTCAILAGSGGRVACWGDNKFGQLGVSPVTFPTSPTPVVVGSLTNAAQLAAGGSHNCARTAANTLYCWGANTANQLGVSGGSRTTPVLVGSVSNVLYVAAGYQHTCVVSGAAAGATSGKVFCFGKLAYGALGNGAQGNQNTSSLTPVEVTGITDATQVSVAGFGGCARRANGTVSCWGHNYRGIQGTGATGNFGVPTLAGTAINLTNASFVAVGSGRSGRRDGGVIALQSTGTASCWGGAAGRHGVCGVVSGTSVYPQPTAVAGVANIIGVARGRRHACMLINGGTVKCMGRGERGQRGDNTTNFSSGPVDVFGLTGATQISAGGETSCAVLNTGAVTCWGSNDQGQLGNPAAAGNAPTVVSNF